MDVVYKSMADAGDSDFKQFWKRYKDDPSNIQVANASEGLKAIADSSKILHLNIGMLNGELRLNPRMAETLLIFGQERPEPRGLVLTKYSPLTPLFKIGSAEMLEKGKKDRIYGIWTGEKIMSRLSEQKIGRVVVNGGQMFSLFALMASTYLGCLAVLLIERYFKKWTDKVLQLRQKVRLDVATTSL